MMQIPELIEGVEELLSLPEVVVRANELIDSPSADFEDVAEVIALDPSLAAQLLKLVNSAFYGFPNKIETISRAITLVGTRELRNLIMSASAVDSFNRIAPDSIDMNDFWFRSVYVGLAAKQIANDRRMAEQMFLMGLLHDVGKIVLFSRDVDTANQLIHEIEQVTHPVYQVEKDILGYTLSEVSAALLEQWGLAENIWRPIANMYCEPPAEAVAHEAQVLQLAARLADSADPDQQTTVREFEALKQEKALLEATHLKPDDLEQVMTEVNLYCFDVLGVINPDASLIY